MPSADIVRESEIVATPRVLQLQGMFDVPPAKKSRLAWHVELPLEAKPWNVGLIVGPSGCGKSTIAREMFGNELVTGHEWPATKSIVDGFPAGMSIKEISLLLSSVGFSSPPAWLRPFSKLSNGEQFRVTVARALAEAKGEAPVVLDEFTSVVDRTVAQVGSAAVARTVRQRGQKFIAVTCHYDVADWLQPDWVYEVPSARFEWRSLQRRPAIELEINRVHHSAWRLFAHHHYLSHELNKSAVCFVAFWKGRPVVFSSWLMFMGRLRGDEKARREHRTVCLPDYQGLGLGNIVSSHLAAMWRGQGYRVFSGTSHPSMINHRLRDKNWRMTRAPGRTSRGKHGVDRTRAWNRMMASFEWVGNRLTMSEAQALLAAQATINGD